MMLDLWFSMLVYWRKKTRFSRNWSKVLPMDFNLYGHVDADITHTHVGADVTLTIETEHMNLDVKNVHLKLLQSISRCITPFNSIFAFTGRLMLILRFGIDIHCLPTQRMKMTMNLSKPFPSRTTRLAWWVSACVRCAHASDEHYAL